MKKSYFLVSAVMALCLCACQGKGSNTANSGSQQQSSAAKMEPEVAPTMEVAFKAIDSTVTVPSYVKEYIDAMKEQEGKITRPYRVDSLFCNMDWQTAANQADKGDGTKYDDDHSGGVDVCEMLNRNQSYENVPVEIKWEKGDKDLTDAKLLFWSEDKADKREVAIDAENCVAKLPNLYRNTKYYYQIVKGNEASQMKNFVTEDYTRMITMGKISNVRDMGGNMTSYGIRTKQGLIYRGGEMAPTDFNDGGNRHTANWSDAAQEVQKSTMKIGLELDLRTKSGSGNMTESPLEINEEGTKAEYKRCAINSFDKFITDPNRSSESENANRNLVKEIFEAYSNADQKHVYFHCWGGADRTGVTGFLLNAILGVSYTDAIIDFELTTLTNNKRCHMHNSQNAHMPKFLNLFVTGYEFSRDGQTFTYTYDADKTLNYNATNLLKAMGVEEQTIEKIRTIMLPGYETGKTQETDPENKPWEGGAQA